MGSGDQELLRAALKGDRAATGALIDQLTPTVQARVARVLLVQGGLTGRDVRRQVEDLTQEVFLSLFDDDGRVLRSWRPELGLSLQNFVGMVAQRQAISIIRSGRANPFTEDPTVDAKLTRMVEHQGTGDVEDDLASKEMLRLVLARLQTALSLKGLEMFHRLVLSEEPVANICRETGLSEEAVYAWRSRLARMARDIAREILGEQIAPPDVHPARTSREQIR